MNETDDNDIIYQAVAEAKKMNEEQKIKALMGLCLRRMTEIGKKTGATALNKEEHPFEHTITMGLITMARALDIMDDTEMRRILDMDATELLN